MKASPNFEDALQWLRVGQVSPGEDLDPRVVGDEAMNRRARLFKAVFASRDGELVLQTILEATLFRAPVDMRLEGEPYLRHAQTRHGQNQAAAMILAYLDHADQLERRPADHETTVDDERRPDLFAGPGGAAWTWPGADAGPSADPDPDAGTDPRAGSWDIAVR